MVLRGIHIRPTEQVVDSKIKTANYRSLSTCIAQLATLERRFRFQAAASASTATRKVAAADVRKACRCGHIQAHLWSFIIP